jgi:hypothetical protein
MTLNCWHARATTWLAKRKVHEPRRRASRIDAMLCRAIRPSFLCHCACTRSFCAESEHFAATTSVAPNDKSTLTLDDVLGRRNEHYGNEVCVCARRCVASSSSATHLTRRRRSTTTRFACGMRACASLSLRTIENIMLYHIACMPHSLGRIGRFVGRCADERR